ncbi:unnamed protein product [Mytilus coruscus]|uniref:Peptidase A2 domain-containing protein n=1 Tax=Mytilus coruscus TaxID=42192 RepID=A0A6J8CUS9_MYTCO|nr:unnamed protein product [Mytilus coruscus]
MSTININTATKEELMGIRDIGEARANLIIKARKIKGTLTLEDLKMIEGVPNTIWDPLIRKAQDDTFAILEQYKTKLLIVEQDKVHSKREYMKEVENLKVTFEKQLRCKSVEIEECLAELQQTKYNLHREMEKDQLEREKSQKELISENIQIKQEMSELQHQYESTMAEKEGDFSGRMESMQRELQTLMDKVMEQAQEMDKERERSKEQYKQMKQRDAEYGRKLAALEEQLQHVKTSRLISEKLAPGDIFRGKVTEMSASSWYSDSAKLKSRQALSSDKLGDSTEEVTNNGKMSTSGKGKDDSSSTTEQHIWTIKSDIKKIINSISPKTTADRQRSPSPRRRSPTRDRGDFKRTRTEDLGRSSVQKPQIGQFSPLRELKPEVLGKKQVTISDSSAVHCNLTDSNSGQKEDSENGIDNPQLREVQLYPGDRNPESNTLVLGISINDVTVNAVIDTAAQVTLMIEEFAKKLKPSVIFKGSLMLKGAGKDNSITARYTERVTVMVGKTDTKWKIIVPKINDQVILGFS